MDYKLLGQRIRASRLAAELSQEQFKQIIDEQPLDRKQMSVNVLRTIFSYFDQEGA